MRMMRCPRFILLREKVTDEDDSKTYPIQWRVANDAVFIDVAGSLWEEKTPEQSSTWLSFTRWIATQRPDKPLNGLVLTLSVDDLIYATALLVDNRKVGTNIGDRSYI